MKYENTCDEMLREWFVFICGENELNSIQDD